MIDLKKGKKNEKGNLKSTEATVPSSMRESLQTTNVEENETVPSVNGNAPKCL